jgi:GAF domain-containing protein
VRELGALNSIAATVSQSLDISQILNDTLDKMLQVMLLEGEIKGAIFLLNAGAGELRLAALRGLPVEFGERETAIRLDTCLCGRVVETGEIIDATRVNAWPERPGWVEPHGHLLVPLKSKGKTMGVVSLYLPDTCHPSDSEMQLLAAIWNQIGVSVENAKLYERLEEQALGSELLYEVGRRLRQLRAAGRWGRWCAAAQSEADACLLPLIEETS